MLKRFNYTSFKSADTGGKCAEVYYQDTSTFSIICTACELKSFEFAEFIQHFQNVHNCNSNASTEIPELSISLKNVEKSKTIDINFEILKEEQVDVHFQETEQIGTDYDHGQEIYEISLQPAVENIKNKCKQEEQEANNEEWLEEGLAQDSAWDEHEDSEVHDDWTEEEESPKILKRKQNKRNASDKTFECAECKKCYKLEKSLQNHIQEAHSPDGEKKFQCNECENTVFNTERSYHSHLIRVHRGFKCEYPDCNKIFPNKKKREHHSLMHIGERNYVCDVENCGKAFIQPRHLSMHKKRVHIQTKDFVCEVCGFRTKSRPALVVHERVHTGKNI